MKIKLDENLSRHLKPALDGEGHDTVTAAGEDLLGKSDVEIGSAAGREGRMLFTLDLEFADLRKHPPGSHPGVVLFRPRGMGPGSVSDFVLEFAQGADLTDLAGCVAVVEPTRVRLRRPPLDTSGPGWREVLPR